MTQCDMWTLFSRKNEKSQKAALEIEATSSNGYKTVDLNDDKLPNTAMPSYNTSDHVTVRLPTSNNTNLLYVKRDADDDVTRRCVPSQMTSDDSTQIPVQYFVLDQAQVDRERPVDLQYWSAILLRDWLHKPGLKS